MTIDIAAAHHFLLTHARVLEKRRFNVLCGTDAPESVIQTLAGYQNPDGGYGHGLEPDVRSRFSETTSTLVALEHLSEHGGLENAAANQALSWVGSIIDSDGSVPFILPVSMSSARAPWMQPSTSQNHLTFGFVALARRAHSELAWLQSATRWCWEQIDAKDQLQGHMLKNALRFLDTHSDDPRSTSSLARIKPLIREDGSIPVPGGTAEEKLTPLMLSPHPRSFSRALFTDQQIADDLNALEAGQQADGGWTFDWLEWCPAQGLDWRGVRTLEAVALLSSHHRLPAAQG